MSETKKLTNGDLVACDTALARYMGTIDRITPELGMQVRKHVKLAYGLMRNVQIVRPYLDAMQEVLKPSEALQEYYKAKRNLEQRGPGKDKKMQDAILELEAAHTEALNEHFALQERNLELMKAELTATPEFYKMPVSLLPGWESGEGVLLPGDLLQFMQLGIFYDPAEVPAPVADPAN
jgi:hypothetical protein